MTDTVYIGIDPTAGRRPMNYAVLDGDLNAVVLEATGGLMEVLSAVLAGAAQATGQPGPAGGAGRADGDAAGAEGGRRIKQRPLLFSPGGTLHSSSLRRFLEKRVRGKGWLPTPCREPAFPKPFDDQG